MKFTTKLQAHGWLWIVNSLLAVLICTRYFEFIAEFPQDFLGIVFVVVSTLSQMTLLAGLLTLLTVPLLILPARINRVLRASVAAFGLAFLFVDTLVFAQYRFHINTVMLELIFSGQVVDFPLQTWLMVIGSILLLILFQYALIYWLDHRESKKVKKYKAIRKFSLVLLVALILTNMIHVWASAHVYQSVTMFKRYLPLFYPARANKMMAKFGWINAEEVQQQQALTLKRKKSIQYPLAEITAQEIDQPTNILLIVVDSWRADTFSQDNTPNMWSLAQQGMIFKQHLATGNGTRSGIFGLFYGIPATYWEVMFNSRIGPVLINRLKQLDYQLGIFASAQLRTPEFNQTVFVEVDNLREESIGKTPAQRDANLTEDWLLWHQNADKTKPMFSFLFYDAAHGYDFPNDYPHRYEPMLDYIDYLKLTNDSDPVPFTNRYKTSVHYIDSLVEKVLSELEKSGELDSTLVVITGDHSQEMNDNKQNYWGHNGNFSYAQIHVPLAIIEPKNRAKKTLNFTSVTDHQDIVPTLMENYLGVTSEIETYSTGRNILIPGEGRGWVIAGNYDGYALTSPERILQVNPAGQYELLDKHNRPVKGEKLDAKQVQEAIEMMSRFSQ